MPPWAAVYQQTRRWVRAGCFQAIVDDLRMLPRLAEGRHPLPTAAIFDSRTLQGYTGDAAAEAMDGILAAANRKPALVGADH